jgi:hypothetical protein
VFRCLFVPQQSGFQSYCLLFLSLILNNSCATQEFRRCGGMLPRNIYISLSDRKRP